MHIGSGGKLEEILHVYGDDDEVVPVGILEEHMIECAGETDMSDGSGVNADLCKTIDEGGRQVLVEEDIHAGARLKRSRLRGRPGPGAIAANSFA